MELPRIVAKTANMDRWEWLEERRRGIGGSDVAAIAGIDEYSSPIKVYLIKTGQFSPPEAGEAAYWGNQLEDVVAKEFLKRYINDNIDQFNEIGKMPKVQRCNKMFCHDDHDFMFANLDREIICPIKGKGILECKTANQFMSDEWAGEDVPNKYLLQVQHYLSITGYSYAYIAVLIGGQKFKYYFIPRHEEMIEYIIDIESAFWNNHVIPKIPPVIDGQDSTVEMMKIMYPGSYDEPVVNLPDSAIDWLKDLENAKISLDEWKEEKQRIENVIKDYMKEQSEAWAGPHKITWRANKNGVRSFKIKMNAKKEN